MLCLWCVQVEAASELLSSLQNTYLANVSIDVAEQSKQSNEIMKNLSAVATIVLPLSLVAGIMGMNVQVPWQHDSNNDLATLAPFIVICGGMVIVTILMIVYFKYVTSHTERRPTQPARQRAISAPLETRSHMLMFGSAAAPSGTRISCEPVRCGEGGWQTGHTVAGCCFLQG